MDSSSPQPSQFSLRDLLTAVAVIALGLAVCVPYYQMDRGRSGRRSECTNNLKQIGLAFQNYHDINSSIPPSYLTSDNSQAAIPSDHAAWPLILLPYAEQAMVYDLLDLAAPVSADTSALPTNHALVRATSIFIYFCPTRRTPPRLTVNDECSVGDYANISRTDIGPNVVPSQPRTWDGAMVASRVFNPSSSPLATPWDRKLLNRGEFRSMTNFASVLDGLSNTAFIGEKAVHQNRMGGNKKNFVNTRSVAQQDGPFYYGSGGNPANLIEPGEMAYWSRRLAPVSVTERLLPLKPRLEDPRNRFGSWHPGVTLFVLGDGSVRGVNNATSTLALQRLGCRNDRQTFDLP